MASRSRAISSRVAMRPASVIAAAARPARKRTEMGFIVVGVNVRVVESEGSGNLRWKYLEDKGKSERKESVRRNEAIWLLLV